MKPTDALRARITAVQTYTGKYPDVLPVSEAEYQAVKRELDSATIIEIMGVQPTNFEVRVMGVLIMPAFRFMDVLFVLMPKAWFE